MNNPLAAADEIRAAYGDAETVTSYIANRFTGELTTLLHDRQVHEVNQAFARYKPLSALEIAPGPGRITRDVESRGVLTCVEYNQSMINAGRAAGLSHVQWIRGDAFALPLACRFDLVYSFRFIRHFHRDDRNRLYAEIHRVLKPEGILLMDAVNKCVSEPLRSANPEAYPIYDKLYENVGQLEQELADAGFELISATPVQCFFGIQSHVQNLLGPRWRWLCRKLVRGLESLRRGPALEWIVTCRRG